MKFNSISEKFFQLCSFDKELMDNENTRRPYLIIIKLKYQGKKYDFALPFRSNIANYIPQDQYFSLPPRPKTKANKIHGLHYIKMFPIRKEYLQKFHTNNSTYYETISNIIKKYLPQITTAAQKYLDDYQDGIITEFSTNIHGIFAALYPVIVSTDEAAPAVPEDIFKDKQT